MCVYIIIKGKHLLKLLGQVTAKANIGECT